MTAEEKARKYLENKYSELDHTANYDSAGGSELYINEIDVSKLMTDYLNSQRDTIFKEELEKRIKILEVYLEYSLTKAEEVGARELIKKLRQ